MKTNAQKRAQKKWDSKFDVVRFRVKKGKKEQIFEFAKEKGMSVNAFLNKLVDETMNSK